MTPYLWFQHNRTGAALWLVLLRRADAAVWHWSTGQWVTFSEANVEAQRRVSDGEIVAGTAAYQWNLSAVTRPSADEEFDAVAYEGTGVIEDMAFGAVWRWAFGNVPSATRAWNGVLLGTTNPLPNAAPGSGSGLATAAAVAALPTAANNAAETKSVLDAAHGAGSWQTATSVTVSDKTGFKLASDGLALISAWTVNITGNLSGSVGSVTGHTPQTGDVFALANGASGFAGIKADTAAILLDTGTDGVVVSPASKTGYTLAGTITTFDGLASALATAHGDGSWLSGADLRGPGATAWTAVVTSGGVPLADADVWVTTDAAGTDVVAGTLRTNTAGRATFMLDAGVSYYLWAQKNGHNAITASPFTCEAD